MIYSSSRIKPRSLALEDILGRLTEYDIYAYYLGANFQIGIPFSSPFRRDVNPSFGIFKGDSGSLFFKDFGTGDSGNCVSFVQRMVGLPDTKYGYKLALERIYTDLIQNGNGFTAMTRHVLSQKIRNVCRSDKTPLGVKRRSWLREDLDYWNSYNIPVQTLSKFNVSPVQYVFLNDIITWVYRMDNPIYVYKIYNGLKIYRPFAKRSEKWMSSCKRHDVQGLKQLPDIGKLLIITKSLKDIMVLHEIGYPAITPHGENHAIPKNILENLRSRFNRIVVLYDWDKAGKKGSDKLKNKYGFGQIFIPRESNVKDISDYVKKYSLSKGNKLITKLLDENRR